MSKVWYDGEIINADDVKIPLLSFGLQYGWGVFEGIRAYQTGSGYSIFRLREHISRLMRSANILGLDISYSEKELCRAVFDTVDENEGADYIRPLIFGGEGSSVALGTSDIPVHVAVSAVCMGEYVPGAQDAGIKVLTSHWEKPGWRCMPSTAKISGGYVNLILAKRDAMRCGADEALMLNPSGSVAEGSAENIFIVNDNVLSTPPVSSGILKGITRETVMELAYDLGYEVEEKEIVWDEVVSADEVFMCGTALEIQGVVSLDGRIIGSGVPGVVTRQMISAYHDAVRGKIPKYMVWCESCKAVECKASKPGCSQPIKQ